MEHGLTAGSLMLLFVEACRGTRRGSRDRAPRPVLLGVWTGLAVICELQATIPAIFILVFALANLRDRDPRGMVTAVGRIILGGLPFAAVFFLYNALAFGSPFHIGYSSEEGFEQLRTTGFYAITYPHWRVLGSILVGRYRGLLPLAPLVAATPFGVLLLARTPASRRVVVVVFAVAAYYFLLNASYFYWEGGWAYSPRHVMPALPFLALGLAPLWDSSRRWGRMLLAAGWIWGAALTLIAVSTTPQPPSNLASPTVELLWPAFRDGDLSLNTQSFVHNSLPGPLRNNFAQHAAWNLGQIAGLRGHASLAPTRFRLADGRSDSSPVSEQPRQFGNHEANLRFHRGDRRVQRTGRFSARDRIGNRCAAARAPRPRIRSTEAWS